MRWRPRWWLLWLPALLLGMAWLSKGIEPACSFSSLMGAGNVSHKSFFVQTASLGILSCGALAIARVWRGPRDEP
jgi:hypothetical protein